MPGGACGGPLLVCDRAGLGRAESTSQRGIRKPGSQELAAAGARRDRKGLCRRTNRRGGAPRGVEGRPRVHGLGQGRGIGEGVVQRAGSAAPARHALSLELPDEGRTIRRGPRGREMARGRAARAVRPAHRCRGVPRRHLEQRHAVARLRHVEVGHLATARLRFRHVLEQRRRFQPDARCLSTLPPAHAIQRGSLPGRRDGRALSSARRVHAKAGQREHRRRPVRLVADESGRDNPRPGHTGRGIDQSRCVGPVLHDVGRFLFLLRGQDHRRRHDGPRRGCDSPRRSSACCVDGGRCGSGRSRGRRAARRSPWLHGQHVPYRFAVRRVRRRTRRIRRGDGRSTLGPLARRSTTGPGTADPRPGDQGLGP